MKVKVENIETNIIQLEIEVDPAEFDKGMEKSYRKNVSKFSISGFRKGKVPRKVVERYYGEDIFFEDAINFVIPEVYDKVIKEKEIQAVSQPEFDVLQIGNGQNFIFTAKITIKPEVVLGQYLEIEITKQEVSITDNDVDEELNTMAEKSSRLINIEDRNIQKGDIAVIDFEGLIDEKPFEGGEASDYFLEIGSGQFIHGFEDQLIGAKIDDELDVNVNFPEEYFVEELKGKPVTFKVKIKGIKKKEIPVIDNEFAKDVSEFDTLEELRENVRKEAIIKEERKVKRQTEEEVIRKAVENAEIDVPQIMVDNRVDAIVDEFKARLLYQQGIELESYLKSINLELDGFKEKQKEQALMDVKTQLVIEKIMKIENIQVLEEELEEKLKEYAEVSGKNYQEYTKLLTGEHIEYIKKELQFNKTIELLVNSAKCV